MSYAYSKHDGYSMQYGVRIEDGKMHPHREDESNVELAEKLGYTVDRSKQFQRGISFQKGRIHIWHFRNGNHFGWQVADLYPHPNDPKCDYYQNHRPVGGLLGTTGGLAYALLREAYRT